jgi:SAM-dependent methyltransferase
MGDPAVAVRAPEPPVNDKHGRLAALETQPRVVLELGCGNRKRHHEAIGIDAIDYPAVDVVGDVYDVLARFPDGSVDAVYSHHFVEHLPDLARFVLVLRRVVRPSGTVTAVVPHFSNPYFYSDYTHRTAFGLYSFSYLAADRLFRRRVPRYVGDTGFRLTDVNLGFKAGRPFYLRHAIALGIGWVVNSSRVTQELYERAFCYLFPCYEVQFELVRVNEAPAPEHSTPAGDPST